MLIEVNDQKIMDFRKLVNSNNNFVLHTCLNKEGKNQWNLICSSMDWISVAIRNLQNFTELDSNIDVRVMQIYSLISSIDIVHEAITQLHRVFFGCKSRPFNGEKSIFNQRLFDEDDNRYFKEIRACFGAHPVNLNGENKEKRFASWPYEGLNKDESDLQVLLYSNNPRKTDIILNLKVEELMTFLTSRYNYLDNISEEILRQYNVRKKELISTPIEQDTNSQKFVDILLKENNLRFNNSYYQSTLEEIALLLRTQLAEESLQEECRAFHSSLDPLIFEIYNNLQKMDLVDLEYYKRLNPTSELSTTLSYEMSKIYPCLLENCDTRDPLFNFCLKRINEKSNNKYSLNQSDTNAQLLLKIKLVLLNSSEPRH